MMMTTTTVSAEFIAHPESHVDVHGSDFHSGDMGPASMGVPSSGPSSPGSPAAPGQAENHTLPDPLANGGTMDDQQPGNAIPTNQQPEVAQQPDQAAMPPPPPTMDHTTLLQNEEESFALAPLEQTVIHGSYSHPSFQTICAPRSRDSIWQGLVFV